jgi:hypothetical protein
MNPGNHIFATANCPKNSPIKTFALPKLDHLLVNADVGLVDLKTLDQNIRAVIDQALAVHSLPVECHHGSWRDGGASWPGSLNRADVLAIRSLVHMLMSSDAAMKVMVVAVVLRNCADDTA